MKEGLEGARLKAYLMSQPLAYHTPDCGKQGFIDLPEFPFGKTDVFYKLSQSLCLRNPGWIYRAREFLSQREMAVLSSLAPPSCPSSQNSHSIRQGRTNRTTKRNNNREFKSETSGALQLMKRMASGVAVCGEL